VDIVVVVGSIIELDSKVAPQVIALAVQLSVIAICKFCQSVGVPDKFVVIDVIAAANAVIVNRSTLSELIVGVALEATVPTLLVILLLVRVAVAEFLVASLVLSTLFRDNVVLTCAGVLLAQALDTETMKLSVVAVSHANVVKAVLKG